MHILRSLPQLIIRVIFGTDMTLGMFIYAALTTAFNEGFDWRIVSCSLIFVHLPDADMIPYLIMKRRLPYRSHWLVGHHALLLIPLYGWAGWHLGTHLGKPGPYLAAIAVLCVMAHLIHDSVQPQGLHWLSPFSWRRFTLRDITPRKVSKADWQPILLRKGGLPEHALKRAHSAIRTNRSLEHCILGHCALCDAYGMR